MIHKFCPNCGNQLIAGAKFCPDCGQQLPIQEPEKPGPEKTEVPLFEEEDDTITEVPTENLSGDLDFSAFNKKIRLKNSQSTVVKWAAYSAIFFFLLILSTIFEWSPLYEVFALAFLSFFLLIMSLVVVFIFRSREKKLDALITGENLLAEWTLTEDQKENYVNHLFSETKEKNKAIFLTIAFMIVLIFGIFVVFMDEAKLFMALMGIGIIILLSAFAFGMPVYYRNKNRNGDGIILIGAKYAYINGYFHNWDFPLSGLSNVKIIKTPFYGIDLVYYYTDRTMEHSQQIKIPANTDIDLAGLIKEMKDLNQN